MTRLDAVGDGKVLRSLHHALPLPWPRPARTGLLSLLCSALADKKLPTSSSLRSSALPLLCKAGIFSTSWKHCEVSPPLANECSCERTFLRPSPSAETWQGHQSICKWVALEK